MKLSHTLTIAMLASGFLGLAFADTITVTAQTPKEVASRFFNMAFDERKPLEAAMQYISATQYIQHNPTVDDGREAFIKGYAAYIVTSKTQCKLKRTIAEGDLVMIHSQCFDNPKNTKDRGTAVVDIFRVADSKIVEHWDVMQAVPKKAANKNTMF